MDINNLSLEICNMVDAMFWTFSFLFNKEMK